GYPLRIVSAPATYCTSDHASPASASAALAAANPYSTKFRPHLPHGCIPAPSTATSLSNCSLRSLRAAASCALYPRLVLAPPPRGGHGTGLHLQPWYSASSSS